jgi:hypothetical protein
MGLKQLRIRSLLWLAVSAVILVAVGVVLCLDMLGIGYLTS